VAGRLWLSRLWLPRRRLRLPLLPVPSPAQLLAAVLVALEARPLEEPCWQQLVPQQLLESSILAQRQGAPLAEAGEEEAALGIPEVELW